MSEWVRAERTSKPYRRLRKYEFTPEVKAAGLERAAGVCEHCHEPFTPMLQAEYHHLLQIEFAVKEYTSIPHTLINSLANLLVVCNKCHPVLDRRDRIEHQQRAQELQAKMSNRAKKIASLH